MKHYYFNNVELHGLPDPFKGVSPMTDARFVSLGGTITDDGQPTPEEKFLSGLDDYLKELEKQAREKYALNITVAEFKQAAATMMSGELVQWAKSKGVPDAMIESVRADILVMIADASRLGMSWGDIFPKN